MAHECPLQANTPTADNTPIAPQARNGMHSHTCTETAKPPPPLLGVHLPLTTHAPNYHDPTLPTTTVIPAIRPFYSSPDL